MIQLSEISISICALSTGNKYCSYWAWRVAFLLHHDVTAVLFVGFSCRPFMMTSVAAPMVVDDDQAVSEQNIWAEILKQTKSGPTFTTGHILLAGDCSVGKRSLVSRLRKEEVSGDDAGGIDAGMDFTYVDYEEGIDEAGEVEFSGRISIWTVEEDDVEQNLLQFAVNPQNAKSTVISIVADISRPWSMVASLEKYVQNRLNSRLDGYKR